MTVFNSPDSLKTLSSVVGLFKMKRESGKGIVFPLLAREHGTSSGWRHLGKQMKEVDSQCVYLYILPIHLYTPGV